MITLIINNINKNILILIIYLILNWYWRGAGGGVLGRGRMVEKDGGGDGVQRECMDGK